MCVDHPYAGHIHIQYNRDSECKLGSRGFVFLVSGNVCVLQVINYSVCTINLFVQRGVVFETKFIKRFIGGINVFVLGFFGFKLVATYHYVMSLHFCLLIR